MHPVRERTWCERQVKGFRRFWKTLGQRMPERIWVSWVLLRLVWSRAYSGAKYAVRKIATDPDLGNTARREHLKALVLKQANLYPTQGENLVRRGEAQEGTERWCAEHHVALSRRERNVLSELAYLAYAARGR